MSNVNLKKAKEYATTARTLIDDTIYPLLVKLPRELQGTIIIELLATWVFQEAVPNDLEATDELRLKLLHLIIEEVFKRVDKIESTIDVPH